MAEHPLYDKASKNFKERAENLKFAARETKDAETLKRAARNEKAAAYLEKREARTDNGKGFKHLGHKAEERY